LFKVSTGDSTLKLGILSDSHVNKISDLPKKALEILKNVDLIIHAGDYYDKTLVDELKKLANFEGVSGNMDPKNVKNSLPEIKILELKGFKIGVTHPFEGGAPYDLVERIREKFKQIDVIVYGHSHVPMNERIDGVLFFNPGSITGRWPAKHKTIGILEIEKNIKGKIITLD
jgi:putative phosphoesterase